MTADNTEGKKLFLLDAYAMIYKSYYAFIKNPIRNSKGLNTSAALGFTNALDEVLRKEKPTHIAVAFDPGGLNFRHFLYSDYKANRPPAPEDIKLIIPYIKQIIRGFNIPVLEKEGFEADDVIGTVSKSAEKAGFKVYMMTSDKDYCQLVSENIYLFKPQRAGNEIEIWGISEVQKEFKVKEPIQVIDVFALWGDSSDNVPGAQGIGEKTAKDLIEKYETIENLYLKLDEVKPKQKEKLIAGKDSILLSKKLVTIDVSVPLEIDFEDFIIKPYNREVLQNVFDELEFRALSKRILQTDVIVNQKTTQLSLFDQYNSLSQNITRENGESNLKDIKNTPHDYKLVRFEYEIDNLINILSSLDEFCFDTETTSLNTHMAELVGISFSKKKSEAFYIPIPSDQSLANNILKKFKPVFENSSILKIGQNIKFDMMMLKNYGISVESPFFDTMIAHYLIDPEGRHNMDYLSELYLNYKPVPIEELIGKKGNNQGNMRNVNLDLIKEYACEDADITWQLKDILKKLLIDNELEDLFNNIEMPLIHSLIDMEMNGVKVDSMALHGFANELREKILEINKEIVGLAGFDFNISSPKQLGEILFERLKIISDPKRTKTKQYSTSEKDLLQIKDKHPIIEKILEYRSLTKLLTTYVETLPSLINPKSNRIHTSFNQAITSTGRLSSNNPNLQNIPIKTAEGRKIREAFVPSAEDHVLFSADYSQVELRIMAHLSNDANMIEAFSKNEDIHSATASKIFNIDLGQVTREMRSKAKSANFGIIYGISSFGLADNLNISRKEAKQLIDSYFSTYPGVKVYMDASIEFARQKGYVSTIFGRKRILNDINSKNAVVRGFAERNAINAPIQGTAADIIKIAMINIRNRLIDNKLKTKMLLQVHDELLFDVPKNEIDAVMEIVKFEMENVVKLKVPLVVESGMGNNWLKAH